MTQAHMIEGTTEERTRQMQQSYAGQNLRVFIESEENEAEEAEDFAATLPTPPGTIRDKAHLVELLREGMNSPATEFTGDILEQMRQEVRRRLAERQP